MVRGFVGRTVELALLVRAGKPALYRVADSNLRFYLAIGRAAQDWSRRGNRAFQPEIDLVGADRAPVAREICYAGSVKWLDRPFDDDDYAALQRDAMAVPGFEPGRTGLVAVSRAGTAPGLSSQLALCWGPRDVVTAFSAGGADAGARGA